jgi:trans-2,3-dihydro-3-hydroxyanthranilate isomerase
MRKLRYCLVDVFTDRAFGGNPLAVFTDADGISPVMMQAMQFRRDVWERVLRDFEAPHVFVFTEEVVEAGSTVHSRMFAPAMGIAEDPATGAASGPLGCYLVRHGRVKPGKITEIVSEQGLEMGGPSFIRVRIEQAGEQITGVHVGGQCYWMGEGTIEVPESEILS